MGLSNEPKLASEKEEALGLKNFNTMSSSGLKRNMVNAETLQTIFENQKGIIAKLGPILVLPDKIHYLLSDLHLKVKEDLKF